MSPSIVVIDYLKGNLRSVERGLELAGAQVRVTSDADAIARAEALVLPGVGAFGDASATMAELGQDEAVRKALSDGASFLGICLGLHLMFERGEERSLDDEADEGGEASLPRGLGLLPGVCEKIERFDAEGRRYKVPHVGWNTLEPVDEWDEALLRFEDCALLEGIEPGEYFYFTHSYRAPNSPASVACTQHSRRFPSVVAASDRIFGVQFHPEKSSEAGARLLRNFVSIAVTSQGI